MKTYASINKLIVKTLSQILPTALLKYSGKDNLYATFRVSSRKKRLLASGDNYGISCYGFIDVFSKSNPSIENSVLGKIDEALSNAGFTVLNITDAEYVYDKGEYHAEITFRYLYER